MYGENEAANNNSGTGNSISWRHRCVAILSSFCPLRII